MHVPLTAIGSRVQKVNQPLVQYSKRRKIFLTFFVVLQIGVSN
jgi:hypothetical protein